MVRQVLRMKRLVIDRLSRGGRSGAGRGYVRYLNPEWNVVRVQATRDALQRRWPNPSFLTRISIIYTAFDLEDSQCLTYTTRGMKDRCLQ